MIRKSIIGYEPSLGVDHEERVCDCAAGAWFAIDLLSITNQFDIYFGPIYVPVSG